MSKVISGIYAPFQHLRSKPPAYTPHVIDRSKLQGLYAFFVSIHHAHTPVPLVFLSKMTSNLGQSLGRGHSYANRNADPLPYLFGKIPAELRYAVRGNAVNMQIRLVNRIHLNLRDLVCKNGHDSVGQVTIEGVI